MNETFGLKTAMGQLIVRLEDGYVVKIGFSEAEYGFYASSPSARQAKKELEEYFQKERQMFSFPYRIKGSAFALKVLETLKSKVPYGTTISYKELAALAGSKGASRAVGTVMAKNPLPILFPCHRVIRSDGNLGEYAFGSDRKARLLELEKAAD